MRVEHVVPANQRSSLMNDVIRPKYLLPLIEEGEPIWVCGDFSVHGKQGSPRIHLCTIWPIAALPQGFSTQKGPFYPIQAARCAYSEQIPQPSEFSAVLVDAKGVSLPRFLPRLKFKSFDIEWKNFPHIGVIALPDWSPV